MALDFYDNGNLSVPRCALCDDYIKVEDGKWVHPDVTPPQWKNLANRGLEGFKGLVDATKPSDEYWDHPAIPHDGRTVEQDAARKELENYDVISKPEENGYKPEDVEGKVDIEPKLFAQNVGKQLKRYVPPPPNKWGLRGPGRRA